MIRQRRLPDPTDNISVKFNITKKLARGLGGPSDGLHDPALERINWNVAAIVYRESRLMPFRIRKIYSDYG